MVAIRTQALGATITRLEYELGLSTEEIASALGVFASTLEQLRQDGAAPQRDVKARLDALVALNDHLHETLKPEAVPRWLRERPRYLGGATPADTIARGDFDRIEALLTIIDYGMFA